jgi:hypothetical protein
MISYMTETHMLKPFDKRLYATYNFMEHLIAICQRDAKVIGDLRKKVDAEVSRQKTFNLAWGLDESKVDTITFKGYEAAYKPSEVSGLKRLFYDRNKPYSKTIKFFNTYKATAAAEKPVAYVIPQAWGKVIDLFKLNRVAMKQLAHDTTLDLQMYYIADYKTGTRPYEGHYIHSRCKAEPCRQQN